MERDTIKLRKIFGKMVEDACLCLSRDSRLGSVRQPKADGRNVRPQPSVQPPVIDRSGPIAPDFCRATQVLIKKMYPDSPQNEHLRDTYNDGTATNGWLFLTCRAASFRPIRPVANLREGRAT